MSFAQCFGFKNIQNLIRKMKTKRCTYDYVEIMACPGGCLNGGGQIKPDAKTDNAKAMLSRLAKIHSDRLRRAPVASPLLPLVEEWVGAGSGASRSPQTLLRTQYHAIDKASANPLAIKW